MPTADMRKIFDYDSIILSPWFTGGWTEGAHWTDQHARVSQQIRIELETFPIGNEAFFIISGYPFPDVTAVVALLGISRSSAVRPTLQALAPIQSPHPSHNISLIFLCFLDFLYFHMAFIAPFVGVHFYKVHVSHAYVAVCHLYVMKQCSSAHYRFSPFHHLRRCKRVPITLSCCPRSRKFLILAIIRMNSIIWSYYIRIHFRTDVESSVFVILYLCLC